MHTNEGVVETILPGGEGVVRPGDGKSILIQNVVEGDHIRFQPLDRRRGAQRGELVEVIKPAAARIEAPCAVASICGGCALQSMTLAEQGRVKTSWVTQAFKPYITNNTAIIPLNPHREGFAGRRRVRWFVENRQLGFRKRSSHHIVQTSQCLALTETLDALRKQLEESISTLPESIQSIQTIELSNGSHLILESEQDIPAGLALPHIDNARWWWRKTGTLSIKPLSPGLPPLYDSIDLEPFTMPSAGGSVAIEIGPNDFVQGHQQGNQDLIRQILSWSEGSNRIVDLFSGAGNLSLPLAAAFGAKIIGAEANASSVKAANANAKRLKLDAKYQLIDLFGKFRIEPFIGADTLILDPPRKGAKRICKMMGDLFPKQVIMVNCDAAAGARDAQSLQQAGFKLQELRPLDLFPHTGHVEVLSLWKP